MHSFDEHRSRGCGGEIPPQWTGKRKIGGYPYALIQESSVASWPGEACLDGSGEVKRFDGTAWGYPFEAARQGRRLHKVHTSSRPDGCRISGSWDKYTVALTDLKEEFMLWLIDPARQGSYAEWARDHGCNENTLRNWRKDPNFKADLDRRLAQMNVDSVRIQKVVDAMWDKAAQGDVKAAELYLRYIEKIQPSRPVLEDDADVSKLSDEELLAALQAATQVLRR